MGGPGPWQRLVGGGVNSWTEHRQKVWDGTYSSGVSTRPRHGKVVRKVWQKLSNGSELDNQFHICKFGLYEHERYLCQHFAVAASSTAGYGKLRSAGYLPDPEFFAASLP